MEAASRACPRRACARRCCCGRCGACAAADLTGSVLTPTCAGLPSSTIRWPWDACRPKPRSRSSPRSAGERAAGRQPACTVLTGARRRDPAAIAMRRCELRVALICMRYASALPSPRRRGTLRDMWTLLRPPSLVQMTKPKLKRLRQRLLSAPWRIWRWRNIGWRRSLEA